MTSPTADVSVRIAWPSDARAIAACQIAAWRQSYGAVLPADTLAALDADEFAAVWTEALSKPKDARARVLVALERASVRGFALVGPSADPDADSVADAEIAEFVIDPSHRRAGHGSRLLQACVDTLRSDKFSRAFWWTTTTDDILRDFVTGTGWAPDGAHRALETAEGAGLKQIRLHSDLSD